MTSSAFGKVTVEIFLLEEKHRLLILTDLPRNSVDLVFSSLDNELFSAALSDGGRTNSSGQKEELFASSLSTSSDEFGSNVTVFKSLQCSIA